MEQHDGVTTSGRETTRVPLLACCRKRCHWVEATAILVLIWEKTAAGGIVEEATGKKAGGE